MSNMVVRTNIFALNAHRNMKNVGLEQQRASNRLSSGYRINSAADDAAGLAISETMRAQIRGLDQASRNAQDGQAMLLTTEGGLEEIGNMLQRVRELLVQASNDTNTQGQRTMIEQEVNQLAQEIASMQQRVEFNTNRVLAMGPAMVGTVANDMGLLQEDMNVLTDAFNIVNTNLHNVTVAREMLSALPGLADVSTLNPSQMTAVNLALGAVGFDDLDDFQTTTLYGEDLENHNLEAVTAEGNLNQVIALLDERTIELNNIASALNINIGALHIASTDTFNTIRDFVEFREIATTTIRATTLDETIPGVAGYWVFTPAADLVLSDFLDTAPAAVPSANFVGMDQARISALIASARADGSPASAGTAGVTGTSQFIYGNNIWTVSVLVTTAGTDQISFAAGALTLTGALIANGTFPTATAASASAVNAFVALADWHFANTAVFDAQTESAFRDLTLFSDEAGRQMVFIAGTGFRVFDFVALDDHEDDVLDWRYVAGPGASGTAGVGTGAWQVRDRVVDTAGDYVYVSGDGYQYAWRDAVSADGELHSAVAVPNLPTDYADPEASAHGITVQQTNGRVLGTWEWTAATEDEEIEGQEGEYRPGMDAGSSGDNVAWFQVGANANQGIQFDFETVSRVVTGAASNVTLVATLLSNPAQGSGIGRGISVTPLISQIQGSLDDVNTVRANLGAVQNRMDYTMRSLDISSENLQDSESRVRNADIAREMMRFTMANVLQQAAVSMLAQANQLPNNLLQLLR